MSAAVLTVYVLFQRFFVSGLSQGAVRGWDERAVGRRCKPKEA